MSDRITCPDGKTVTVTDASKSLYDACYADFRLTPGPGTQIPNETVGQALNKITKSKEAEPYVNFDTAQLYEP